MNTAESAARASQAPQASDAQEPAPFTAFWFGLRFILALWLCDVARAIYARSPYPVPTALGLAAALFVGLLAGGALGAAMQIGLSLANVGQHPRLYLRVRDWFWSGDAREHEPRLAALFALPWSLAVFVLGSYWFSQRLIVGMARPEFAALALAGAHVVWLAVAVAVFVAARGAGHGILLALAGPARVRLQGLRAWQFAAGLSALGVLALALFGFLYREPLSYLPWQPIVQVGIALVLSIALGLLPSLPAGFDLVLRCAGVIVVLATAVAASSLTAPNGYARRVAQQSSVAGQFGYSALRAAFDLDRDGYLSFLGGGDCQPNDPTRNPAAIDVPGNGIDEDCDGRDLDPRALAPRGRYDLPVPDAVPHKPPIVLITIDAFASDRLAALGGKRGVTKHLDSLVAGSAFFRQAYAQGPSTRLSFPALFTSRWDSQIKQKLIGKHPFPIDSSEQLLADVLRAQGYDTTAVLGDGYFSPRRWSGITRGFSRIVDSPITGSSRPVHNGPKVTDAAIAELARVRDRPLFMWVHYYDAHSPHVQPAESPVFGKQRSDVYDAELWLVDRELGRLLPAIEQSFGGKALVVVTADHGIAFDAPRHAKFNYGYDLYSSVLHVPLIFHAPFIAPRSLPGVVSTMDVMPTVLNLLRVRPTLALEGTSLVPELLRGERSRPPQLMHQMFLEERLWKSEEPLERVSLRTDRFNLLHDRKSGFYELYDYQRDYFERQNLADDPAFEDTLSELRRQLALLVHVSRRPDAPPAAKPGAPAAERAAQ